MARIALAAASEYRPSRVEVAEDRHPALGGSRPRAWNQTAPTCRETPQSMARCTGNRGSYSAASLNVLRRVEPMEPDAVGDLEHLAISSCCPRRVPSYFVTIRSKNDVARWVRLS